MVMRLISYKHVYGLDNEGSINAGRFWEAAYSAEGGSATIRCRSSTFGKLTLSDSHSKETIIREVAKALRQRHPKNLTIASRPAVNAS